MKRVLLAWLGGTDLACASAGDAETPGPTASVLDARPFDGVVLLSNYAEKSSKAHVRWLQERGAPPTHLRMVALDDPTDYAGIHDAVVRSMEYVDGEFGSDVGVSIHISPGTPAMQAVWVLISKTRYPAELIQSHKSSGVQTVQIPFEISAEYVPDLQRRRDEKLKRLALGLLPEAPEFSEIIRQSPAMEQAVLWAKRGAPRDVPILIQGESGTGKELFARAIHAASPRAKGPFVPVNCGALPRELIEAELFGHVKGAFTGAQRDRGGKFAEASGGTLFLDELGELSPAAQVALLRVLEDSKVAPVGGDKLVPVDVRVLAATHRDLREAIVAREFREDLYHRLAVGVVTLPPLRERPGDLSLLIDHLLADANRQGADQAGFEEKELSPEARNLLLKHPWPGNVRELNNVILRLTIWSSGPVIEVADVENELLAPGERPVGGLMGRELGGSLDLPDLMAELARHYIERGLDEAGGNKTRAAELVGLPSYQTFTNWMNRYDVQSPEKGGAR